MKLTSVLVLPSLWLEAPTVNMQFLYERPPKRRQTWAIYVTSPTLPHDSADFCGLPGINTPSVLIYPISELDAHRSTSLMSRP
jgi:hypothetical protein